MSPVSQGHVDIALSVRAHDRVGNRRTDQAWLDEAWAEPTTRVVKMVGSRFPASPQAVEWTSSA